MENNIYQVIRVGKWNLFDLNGVCKTLYLSGKDMVKRYNLSHWNNSYFKEWIIVLLCNLKNDIYLVKNEKNVVATFQISWGQ